VKNYPPKEFPRDSTIPEGEEELEEKVFKERCRRGGVTEGTDIVLSKEKKGFGG